MYSEQLLEHFQNPKNAGVLAEPAFTVNVENPACGDQLRLTARVEDGVVTAAMFQVRGCTASIGCGSALTVWLTGRRLDEISRLKGSEIAAAIEGLVGGLINESKHAALLMADGVAGLVRVARAG
ncbi:iron-sulfur cluster assembly scaffold protein [Paludibaculum fermentans]|uniref:iron-sulfur cluster assembly scaffold protein n=1 Tax=Paludibaculum fermentans TaxID=1473598 RepID=UPI003EBC9664